MKTEYTMAVLFGGAGGASLGFHRARGEFMDSVGRFRLLCSIDCDPVVNRNHDIITGTTAAVTMDLFDRQQYTDFFGKEPPESWLEVTPWDIWQAFGEQVPDVLFTSPPCKGFSGLLPEKSAKSKKYQALNLLTLRGIQLTLRACEEYGGGIPSFFLLENVPRIKTRGKAILDRIVKLLKKYGYAVDMHDHNCGEIGGLGQNRMRFLLIARNEKKIPNFCYLPPKKKLKTIGDVIGPLPYPGDLQAGGPLHKLPNLEWKTWIRLALIPAGGDWRDLNLVPWEDYRILHEPRGGSFAVEDWDGASRTVTGTAGPGRSNGAAAVNDPRVAFGDGTHTAIYRVSDWEQTGPTVTGAHRPNNGAACINDPRFSTEMPPKFNHAFKVSNWVETAGTVASGGGPSNGGHVVNDPRLTVRDGRHPGVYRIVRFDEIGPCVTGTRFGSGAIAISDPRNPSDAYAGQYNREGGYGVQDWDESAKTVRGKSGLHNSPASIADPRCNDRNGERRSNGYPVRGWGDQAYTITGEDTLGSGAQSISDPRVNDRAGRYTDQFRMQAWDDTAATVTGTTDVQCGAPLVTDPRLGCSPRSGSYGVQAWDEPGTTVTGAGDIHSGTAAISDPRIPDDKDRGVWIIIAPDGTRHRPLTTFEMAMLQGFPMILPDGRPFQLVGCSDAKAREYIGNAVPPDAAEAMGNVILVALMEAEAGITFTLSFQPVWVSPGEEPDPVTVH